MEEQTSSSAKNKNTDREDKEEAGPSTSGNQDKDGGEKDDKKDEDDEVVEAVLTEEDLIQQSQAEYDSGRYSPSLLTSSEMPLDTHTITPEDDLHRLQLARRQLQVTGMRLTHTHSFTKRRHLKMKPLLVRRKT